MEKESRKVKPHYKREQNQIYACQFMYLGAIITADNDISSAIRA